MELAIAEDRFANKPVSTFWVPPLPALKTPHLRARIIDWRTLTTKQSSVKSTHFAVYRDYYDIVVLVRIVARLSIWLC